MVATPPLLSIVIISFICFNLGRLQLFPLPWTPLTGTMPASIRLPSPPSSEKTSSPAQRLFSQLLAAVGLYPQVLVGNSHLCVSLQQENDPNSPVPSILLNLHWHRLVARQLWGADSLWSKLIGKHWQETLIKIDWSNIGRRLILIKVEKYW